MESLTQQKMQNDQRLKVRPDDVNVLALEEKLKNDKNIILPLLKEVYSEIIKHYEPEGKEFKFL